MILIAGDSYAADWTVKYAGCGWPNMLAQKHNVHNLAQAGCCIYKTLKQIESVNINHYDAVIINHTSPNRIYVNTHPVHFADPLHKNSSLIYLDIKEHSKSNPELKVIIFTGHSSKEVAIEALRGDADEYIEKPFDIEDVKEKIESQLRVKDNPNEEVRGLSTKVKLAQRFIAKNYNRSLHLKDVAQEVSLCPKYFSRMFREKTGRNFSEHKIHLRIKMAKQLLRKNN